MADCPQQTADRLARLGRWMRAAARAGDLAQAAALAQERHALLRQISPASVQPPLAQVVASENAADHILAEELALRMQQQARQRAEATRLRSAIAGSGAFR